MEETYPRSKVYNWSSPQDGKAEYDEWLASFKSTCYRKDIGYCVDPTHADLFVPREPIPLAGPGNVQQNRKERSDYEKALREYRADHATAAGYLQASLEYKSTAWVEVEAILTEKPPAPLVDGVPQPGWLWTPVDSLKKALKYLKDTYAPNNATDVATLRQQISELTDEKGFTDFAEKFINLYNALLRAGQPPDESSLREWAMNGIKNPTVKGQIASSSLFALRPEGTPEPTFEQIFKFVRSYIQRMGDSDPYAQIKSTAKTAFLIKDGTKDDGDKKNKNIIRCTKCWLYGHFGKKCTSTHCSICGKPFGNSPYCLNYKNHKEPGTSWVWPQHLRKKDKPEGQSDKSDEPEMNEDAKTAQSDINKYKKALRAAQKRKKDAITEARKKNK